MKISVITATIDPDASIARTVESVTMQTHPDIEHLLIDGVKDREAPRKLLGKRIYHVPKGIYEALNFGISNATGDIIGLVHGGDCLASPDILKKVNDAFEEDPSLDFVYGDVRYVSGKTRRKGRIYYAGNFRPKYLAYGMAPPHPSLYIRREAAEKVGPYREHYIISGDTDMWMRIFADKTLKGRYLPEIFVEMTTGGISTSLKGRLYANNRDKLKALRLNGYKANPLALLVKYFIMLRDIFTRQSRK